MRGATAATALGAALLGGGLLPAAGEPLDLSDPTPRPVGVRFEVSPGDQPGERQRVFTEVVQGWLEPDGPGLVAVHVPGAAVEHFLVPEQDPLLGSFSDFVWRFESASGQVLSADVSGVLRRQLDWGLVGMRVLAHIEAHMSTLATGGFLPPVSLLGHRIFGFCVPEESGCREVPALRLDPATGYVNAVGEIVARSAMLSTRSFSPLGEAIFLELPGAPAGEADGASAPHPPAGPQGERAQVVRQ